MKEGWIYKKLGEVCEVLNGYAFKSSLYVDKGIRVIRITNVQKGFVSDNDPKYYPYDKEKYIQQYILKENDLLISLTGNVGRVGLLNKEFLPAALNQRVACLRIKDSNFLLKFLFHKLNSDAFENDCIINASGIAQKNMSTEWLKRVVIPIPSLSEQLQIVSELDLLSDLIKKQKAQIEELDKLEQSTFYDMFGDPVTNEKGWELKYFSDIASFKNGINYHAGDNGDSIKCIGVGDFKNNTEIRNYDDVNTIQVEGRIDDGYLLKDGDILIVRSNGSKDLVGRNMIVYTMGKDITYSGFCIRCRVNMNVIIPLFLNRILSDRNTMRILRQEGQGCNISNINQKILSSMSIILPPLALQQEFAAKIEAIEQMKAKVRQSLKESEELFNSRMDYYFN